MARVMQKTTSYRSGETVGNVFSLYNQYFGIQFFAYGRQKTNFAFW